VPACLRHVEFLDAEIAAVDRLIATEALRSPQVGRLLTVPGVNVICAAVFLAAVGDVRRFEGCRPLVAYLGLDPRVYQSASGPARGGRISKQGSPQARWALVEAAQSVAQQPGPLHAIYERIRPQGHNVAVVAVARKLAVLFWRILTREEDYAHQQPSLTAPKLRRLELAAGAPTVKGKPSGTWATRENVPHAKKQLAAQAEASYERSVADWQATRPKQRKAGASVTAGRAQPRPPPREASRAADHGQAPDACSLTRHRARAHHTPNGAYQTSTPLDEHPPMRKSGSQPRHRAHARGDLRPIQHLTRDIPHPRSHANSVKRSVRPPLIFIGRPRRERETA
jgi:hypothetical protein